MSKWVRGGGPLGILFCLAACSGVSGESDSSPDTEASVGVEAESQTGALKELKPAAVRTKVDDESAAELKANLGAAVTKPGESSGSGSVGSGVSVRPARNLFAPTSKVTDAKALRIPEATPAGLHQEAAGEK